MRTTIDLSTNATVNAICASERVGTKYSFASTANVLEVLADHGWRPYQYREVKTRVESRVGKQAHSIVLANSAYPVESTNPTIMVKNSHDGLGSLRFLSGLYEMICANGLVVGTSASDINLRHVGLDEQRIVEGVRLCVANLEKAISISDRMKAITLDDHQRMQLAEKAVEMAFDGDKYTVKPYQLLWNHRREQNVPTLWNTFNSIQERVVRGGVLQVRQDGTRVRSRAITSIDRSIKINRGLWDIAETAMENWN